MHATFRNPTDPISCLLYVLCPAAACTEHGFFYVSGHNVPVDLIASLESLSQDFFAQDEAVKMQWRMEQSGKAWRGYFPLGGERTCFSSVCAGVRPRSGVDQSRVVEFGHYHLLMLPPSMMALDFPSLLRSLFQSGVSEFSFHGVSVLSRSHQRET